MRWLAPIAFVAAMLVSVSIAPAFAEVDANTSAALEKQLAAHDQKAVQAARHYFENPAIKNGMLAVLDNVNKSMVNLLSQQNSKLTPQQIEDIGQVVKGAMTERIDLLIRMQMVAALDIFSTDELVALDHFYSSPEGASVLAKMPMLAAKTPAMMQTIMPDYMNDLKNRIKAKGMELKL